MTPEQARELSVYWGDPGPAPGAEWLCCAWCGTWFGPEIRFWRSSHKRVCRACAHDARVGLLPRPRAWLAKHRWSSLGVLERYCPKCPRRHRWHPLTAFYASNHYGHDITKRRTRTVYPSAYCIACTRREKARWRRAKGAA